MREIFHRTSVRQFEDRVVEQDKIDQILRAAMQAPTAGNQQTWEFYVVENKELLEKLSKASPYAGCAANAPVAIVVAYRDGGIFEMYNEIDCAIASENIWLEADSLGLGTVMLGIAPIDERMAEVGKILHFPEDVHAFTIFPIGYPAKVSEQQDRYSENKVHYVK